MKIPKGGIAFFDSGIGGLTVLAACRKYLPDELFYYYGDNLHAPYGNLPPQKIRRYMQKAFIKFKRLKVRAAVIACNTATAVCIDELRKKYTFPIIGTEPAVFEAVKHGGEVFVLSTRATYESERFKMLCKNAQEAYPMAKLSLHPCDGLAGDIEKNLRKKGYKFVHHFPAGKPDVVVLGCTHYIYIEEEIQSFYRCPVVHGNDGVARHLFSVLKGTATTTKLKKVQIIRDKRPCLTTRRWKCKKNAKKQAKQSRKWTKFDSIYFLGTGQVVNKIQYEQMFACKNV